MYAMNALSVLRLTCILWRLKHIREKQLNVNCNTEVGLEGLLLQRRQTAETNDRISM